MTWQRAAVLTRREKRILRERTSLRNRNALLICVFPVMLVAKLIVAYLLPAKYFYDNNRILGMAIHSPNVYEWEGSYRVAANLFESINVANLTTMLEWSICLGIVFTAVVALMILQTDAPDLLQSLFILASIGLLNIYIFTIGKDVIQFVFFLAVYCVLLLPIRSTALKIGLSAVILYFESTFFREYYVLIAALVLVVYAILTFFCRRRRLTAVDLVIIVAILFASIYAILSISSVIMPEEYSQVMALRDSYSIAMEGNADSATFIKNWISGDGLPVFMANYVINAFRMMVPLELALRGPYYWPFFVFQVFVTVYLLNLLRQINRLNEPVLFLALCVFLGYALASFIFEPDFGSWTRHEAATFPVFHLLVLNRYQRIPLTEQERWLERNLV